MVSLIDLAPTILKISDTDIPKSMRGNPLHDLIVKDSLTNNWKKNVFIQISESQVGRAIRTKKWKYSVKAPKRDGILYSKSDVYEGEFLYDLENDPFEKHNLIKDSNYSDVKKELSQLLIKRMVEASESIPKIIVY